MKPIDLTAQDILMMHIANAFQMGAHEAVGQKRKFSGLPYYTHPQAVAEILGKYVPEATPVMMCAAWLHDVLEDTKVTYTVLVDKFGPDVARLVDGLTNKKARWADGTAKYTRFAQKRVDAHRMSSQPWEVKVIKLCDRLHNLPDIIANDPKHAKVYVPETRYLLDTALVGVHDVLWNELDAICNEYFENAKLAA